VTTEASRIHHNAVSVLFLNTKTENDNDFYLISRYQKTSHNAHDKVTSGDGEVGVV